MSQRIIAYVDGFNFYYGVYIGNSTTQNLKWIDYIKLSEILLPGDKIIKLKLFTAQVMALGDPNRPVRQSAHWNALKAVYDNRIDIIKGHFRTDPKKLPIAFNANGDLGNTAIPQRIWVMKTEEKGSDVNLAAHLVHDACKNKFDAALIFSNDADLAEAVKITMQSLHKDVILVNPYALKKIRTVTELFNLHPRIISLRMSGLRSSQLPDPIPGTNIHCPVGWK